MKPRLGQCLVLSPDGGRGLSLAIGGEGATSVVS